jgi:hypothetical protein
MEVMRVLTRDSGIFEAHEVTRHDPALYMEETLKAAHALGSAELVFEIPRPPPDVGTPRYVRRVSAGKRAGGAHTYVSVDTIGQSILSLMFGLMRLYELWRWSSLFGIDTAARRLRGSISSGGASIGVPQRDAGRICS